VPPPASARGQDAERHSQRTRVLHAEPGRCGEAASGSWSARLVVHVTSS